jgi:hypothetical protein
VSPQRARTKPNGVKCSLWAPLGDIAFSRASPKHAVRPDVFSREVVEFGVILAVGAWEVVLTWRGHGCGLAAKITALGVLARTQLVMRTKPGSGHHTEGAD